MSKLKNLYVKSNVSDGSGEEQELLMQLGYKNCCGMVDNDENKVHLLGGLDGIILAHNTGFINFSHKASATDPSRIKVLIEALNYQEVTLGDLKSMVKEKEIKLLKKEASYVLTGILVEAFEEYRYISKELCELDPNSADELSKNLKEQINELLGIDNQVNSDISGL